MANSTQKAEKVANDILDFVNVFGCDEERFANTICQAHRTLQQSVMRLFIATIRKMAEVEPDMRNHDTVKLAKRISMIADEHSLPLI
ncbi:MAG: hypothetical protein NC489_46510 [Ruminococcus flavefaciens]|nr:hypothetical protein [Ruminococcus flavefaciens]